MWNLHSLSATYHLRPSEVIGVDDPWAAYQFDMAVAQFGAVVEGKLNERDKKGKPVTTLARLLGDEAAATQEYAPVSAVGLRKVRVKEDGTWED